LGVESGAINRDAPRGARAQKQTDLANARPTATGMKMISSPRPSATGHHHRSHFRNGKVCAFLSDFGFYQNGDWIG
jgi:hypothetical protein